MALFLRRRRVLLVIFLFSLTYFILATYSQLKNRVVEEEDFVSPMRIEEILKTVKPFHPTPPKGEIAKRSDTELGQESPAEAVFGPSENTTEASAYKCRNSVQGRSIIADENGYVCDLFDLQTNGCCRVEAESSKRYHCEHCTPSGCCPHSRCIPFFLQLRALWPILENTLNLFPKCKFSVCFSIQLAETCYQRVKLVLS